jgi:hypothetical protein
VGKLSRQIVMFAVATAIFAVVPYVGAASADEPTSASCTSELKRRSRESLPACTVVVQCPAESVGCAFAASITIASSQTRGTAQGTLRVTNVDTGSSTEWVCSARAAIIAKGSAAGCSLTTPTSFHPAGTRFSVTCEWTGDTTSRDPRVGCAAAMEPIGGE